ncbi:sodium/bile acid cotransporter 4 [Platysternon megacephalum]|uniref:Sodium/bile acid cotransporter 4 n=1 Tax=Platysternon megacephalum TaxID=55544 RepID=A0A4D9FCE6_9SAUR|nr:sodium/bile acid cotransporter 4 [Platysternon megacephalum]
MLLEVRTSIEQISFYNFLKKFSHRAQQNKNISLSKISGSFLQGAITSGSYQYASVQRPMWLKSYLKILLKSYSTPEIYGLCLLISTPSKEFTSLGQDLFHLLSGKSYTQFTMSQFLCCPTWISPVVLPTPWETLHLSVCYNCSS